MEDYQCYNGMHWVAAIVFPIIVHCNRSKISIILEVLKILQQISVVNLIVYNCVS